MADELYRLSAKDDVRWEYEAREKAWRDERARLNFALHKRDDDLLSFINNGGSMEELKHRLSQHQ